MERSWPWVQKGTTNDSTILVIFVGTSTMIVLFSIITFECILTSVQRKCVEYRELYFIWILYTSSEIIRDYIKLHVGGS